MSTKSIMASLCYFSLFFLPFLFPLVVYFVSDGKLKEHAKSSFISHIVPIISLLVLVILSFAFDYMVAALIVSFILFGIINFIVLVWNLVKGIQILLKEPDM